MIGCLRIYGGSAARIFKIFQLFKISKRCVLPVGLPISISLATSSIGLPKLSLITQLLFLLVCQYDDRGMRNHIPRIPFQPVPRSRINWKYSRLHSSFDFTTKEYRDSAVPKQSHSIRTSVRTFYFGRSIFLGVRVGDDAALKADLHEPKDGTLKVNVLSVSRNSSFIYVVVRQS